MIVLEEKATAQETFDFIVGKLREQGEPSFNGGTCRYRHLDGRKKCAVGWLIPEGLSLTEGTGIKTLVECGMVKQPRDMEMLLRLQIAHDASAVLTRRWSALCASKCIAIADDFALNNASAVAWLEAVF